MDEQLQLLEREYCPPIDQALVHALWNDFAGSPNAVESAREVLDQLKLSALTEESADFDPSGSSGDALQHSSSGKSVGETDSTSNPEWFSETTEDSMESGCFKASEHLDTPTKEVLLAETFPTLRFEQIVHILKKSDGCLSKATDELLNYVYFSDTMSGPEPAEHIVPFKGVDAFSEDHHVAQRSRKGKGKRKQKRSYLDMSSTTTSESDVNSPPAGNPWQHASQHVEFIASRTKIPRSKISSLYHENGASVAATIMALVDEDLAANKSSEEPDAALTQRAIDLVSDLPILHLEYAIALIRLTSPSTSNAQDLAKALVTQPATNTPTRGGIKVVPHYAPIQLTDPTVEGSNLPALPPSALPQSTASIAAARSAAFSQASSAYRKGKSDPLMKSAAGYYAQIGRDLHAHLKSMSESDADALVASQSSSTVLDLHGVSVQSATRIALAKTAAWWHNLGEARIPGGGRTGAGAGYRIITGLGRHSEGGRGKIGPAVMKSLVKEGWKVEVGVGEITVMGLARKR